MADRIVDTVYGCTPLTCATSDDPILFNPDGNIPRALNGRKLSLTPDQHAAIALGLNKLPIVAIQATFRTGKTVVVA
ncbi:unnamed protein product [Strongylus vulgaris]|uniref:Uncharacterized protein n=1 Tax=Strongylus vulgaris TaxID=40348 RepID=A0A3P7JJZ4_STRVU|nr:unnamed protein product [Strongylus vulgaris]